MNEKELIEKMTAGVASLPEHAEVFALRQYSVEEMTRRAKRLIGSVAEMCGVSMDRADWLQQQDRTLARLPMGGRAVIHHASSALKVVTGLRPMQSLFPKIDSRDRLEKLVAAAADRLRISEWVGHRESLSFERLWQIKAAAADRQSKLAEPVLCRIVGAYRQSVGKLPVWGPASVAIKLANEGAIDSVSIQIRETTGEAIEWAPLIRPEEAARQILHQLDSLMGRSKAHHTEQISTYWMRFGYLSLGKRKSQRVLAPHYVAAISIKGEEMQAYQFVIPATEKIYMPICQVGSNPPAAEFRRAAQSSRP